MMMQQRSVSLRVLILAFVLQVGPWIVITCSSFLLKAPPHRPSPHQNQHGRMLPFSMSSSFLLSPHPASVSSDDIPLDDHDDEDEEEDEPVEPGKMRISEIKAELELRGVNYKDCFDKESLVERLETARATGRADPTILEQFNKQRLEQTFSEQTIDIREEDIDKATANDGTLPGGMTPDTFKKLSSNPEIMSLLTSTKMQEAMKLMMTSGREGLEQKLRDDPELQETVRKLDQVLRAAQ